MTGSEWLVERGYWTVWPWLIPWIERGVAVAWIIAGLLGVHLFWEWARSKGWGRPMGFGLIVLAVGIFFAGAYTLYMEGDAPTVAPHKSKPNVNSHAAPVAIVAAPLSSAQHSHHRGAGHKHLPLASATAAPTASPDALKEQEDFIVRLTEFYIRSHDGISSEMMAGLALPPEDWLNTELEKYGKSWRVRNIRGPSFEIYSPPTDMLIAPNNHGIVTQEQHGNNTMPQEEK